MVRNKMLWSLVFCAHLLSHSSSFLFHRYIEKESMAQAGGIAWIRQSGKDYYSIVAASSWSITDTATSSVSGAKKLSV